MKTIAMGLSAMALVLGGAAIAAPGEMKRGPDADGNGVVTRAEAQAAAAQRFARMDHNKDGKVDRVDHEARRAEHRTRMFERLDTNKDGQISKAEFLAERPDGKRMAAGGPGKEGPHHMGRRHGPRGGPMGGMMGRMADADRDGATTQAEFTAAALKRFEATDANKDGQVTQQERQAAREQMKARWQQMRAQKPQG